MTPSSGERREKRGQIENNIDFSEQIGSGNDIHLDKRPSESLATKVESLQQ